MGFGKCLKAMNIKNAIFQDLESFRKEMFFRMAIEQFGFLFGKILKIS